MNNLKTIYLDTPLGQMLAIANEEALYLLEFTDRKGLQKEIERLQKQTSSPIKPGETGPILQIKEELACYFEGSLVHFSTPIYPIGSPFRQLVWKNLRKIPFGETFSYSELAAAIEKPTACRAVAQANGANQLAIIIPCHRVINQSGALGGYAGSIARKEWLLKHEKKSSGTRSLLISFLVKDQKKAR
jgi:O-6-methylguanine DNA methyltransferase